VYDIEAFSFGRKLDKTEVGLAASEGRTYEADSYASKSSFYNSEKSVNGYRYRTLFRLQITKVE